MTSSGGQSLATGFADFISATDSAILTNADSIVNEAVKNNYLLRRFMKGRGPQEILQGGKSIKDQIIFEEDSTFEYYQPGAEFSWTDKAVLSEWEIQWRFCVDHMSWTDHELELNAGGGLSTNARHAVYKRLRRVKEMRLWTSLLNGMENALFATPDSATMEGTGNDVTNPYSIPVFVNERLNGKFRNNVTGDFTSVMNINSTDAGKTKWKPQVTTYAVAAHDNASTGILSAFDDMYLKTRFQAPPTKQEYFENDSLYRQFIACSKLGLSTYTQLLRAQNDRLVTTSMQDPAYLKPSYGGIEVEYVASLDTAALYEDQDDTDANVAESADGGTSGGDIEAGGEAGDAKFKGPRYYWLNANYIKPVFHNKRYMFRHPVITPPNQPFNHIQPIDCWMNMVCNSRNRQGMVSPATAFSTTPTLT